jgi:hypothetical protein
MAGRYGELDYPTLTKRGVATGLGMFVLGLLGETLGPLVFGQLSAWEHTLFFDLEAFGVVILLLSVFVFGIVLPLTE